MEIEILEFIDGARRATGMAVIIDVFRAFSVGCYAYDAGVSGLIATDEVEKAFLLKKTYPDSILAGERKEKMIEGFDLGNSPSEIINADLKGKILIHTTSAGTQGLLNAINADLVLTGSLVNAGAVANYIKKRKPQKVSLVAMGYRANLTADEDMLCAEIIKSILENKTPVPEKRIADLRNTSGKRFFNPENVNFSPPADFFLCTMIHRFDFVLKASKRDDGNIDLVKTDV